MVNNQVASTSELQMRGFAANDKNRDKSHTQYVLPPTKKKHLPTQKCGTEGFAFLGKG